MKEKKSRWYYLQKNNSIYAFRTPRERDYWVLKSGGTMITNHAVMARHPKSEREKLHEAWPNRDHDNDVLLEYYLKQMDTLQAEFDKVRRKRQLIRSIIEHKTGCKYKLPSWTVKQEE